jgi:hypothetical protein
VRAKSVGFLKHVLFNTTKVEYSGKIVKNMPTTAELGTILNKSGAGK